MKQLVKYIFTASPQLTGCLPQVQRMRPDTTEFSAFVDTVCTLLAEMWPEGGPAAPAAVNHMSLGKERPVLAKVPVVVSA